MDKTHFIYLSLMEISFVSIFWLLLMIITITVKYKILFGCVFSFLLGIYLGM